MLFISIKELLTICKVSFVLHLDSCSGIQTDLLTGFFRVLLARRLLLVGRERAAQRVAP